MAGRGGNTQSPEQYAQGRLSKCRSKLTMIRYEAKMSRRQLGEITGYSEPAIRDMEMKGTLNITQAKKIAPVFGLEWYDLVE